MRNLILEIVICTIVAIILLGMLSSCITPTKESSFSSGEYMKHVKMLCPTIVRFSPLTGEVICLEEDTKGVN